jgi:hypothetical protein
MLIDSPDDYDAEEAPAVKKSKSVAASRKVWHYDFFLLFLKL